MIFTTARMLELSEATRHADWLLEGRERAIEALPNNGQRRLAGAILHFAVLHPEGARSALDRIAKLKGLRFLGSGVEYTAYLDQNSKRVIKIKRDSAAKDQKELEKLASEAQHDYNLLFNYLGSATIEQTVRIDEHVLGGGHQTVQIVQPFVEILDGAQPFNVNQETVDPSVIEHITRLYPGADVSLRELVDRSKLLNDQTLALPDTNGSNNVTVSKDGSVKILDSGLVRQPHEQVRQLVLKQLESLDTALDELAA